MAAILLPEWSCEKCTKTMQRQRGCGYPGENATLMGKERLTTCPLYFCKAWPEAFNRTATVYHQMEKGFLPSAGTMEDQPAQLMTAVQLFEAGLSAARSQMRKDK